MERLGGRQQAAAASFAKQLNRRHHVGAARAGPEQGAEQDHGLGA
jgi:hypothetical protein